jgi:hypothetical protein
MRTSVSLYHRYHFPAEIISHCVSLAARCRARKFGYIIRAAEQRLIQSDPLSVGKVPGRLGQINYRALATAWGVKRRHNNIGSR